MKRIVLLVMLALLAGCATDAALIDGRRLIDQGRMEEGVRRLEQASKAHPDNLELRTYYEHCRDSYVDRLLYEGEKARILGHDEQALAAFGQALGFSPGNLRAQAGIDAVRADLDQLNAVREAQALFDAGKPGEALEKTKAVLKQNPSQKAAQALLRRIEEAGMKSREPQLRAEYKKPVTLEFRDAPLKSVFDVLSQSSGINFIFDHDVRPDLRATILLRDTSLEDALNFLLVTNQLEKKVLNENTILVYPNVPNKARDYQELVIRSFYVGNADVKQTLNLVKTVIKTRDVFIDERLNLLVMRDTPEAIRIAEKLIAAQDLVDPEVILEVEVLEIDRNKLTNIGIDYPTQLSAGALGAAGAGQFTYAEWLNRNAGMVNFKITDPVLALNLQQQDTDTNILANPRIRVRNREKAKILIGSKVPVITTTATANVGISESVTYLDVGLKLNVEPNVYPNEEVAMKVGLEVSSITNTLTDQNGTTTYTLGTRNAETVLRLRSGETEVLAGLIQDQEQITANKVPGLGDVPLIGRLFGSKQNQRNKTEIVLLITPYVVRNLDRPPPTALELNSGTEGGFGAAPLRLSGAAGQQQVLPMAQSRVQPAAAQPILLSVPAQVQAGREFAVAISVPPGAPGNVPLELIYDSGKLQALGAEGPPGRVQLAVSGTATVRFRALEGQSGPAQISIGNITASSGGATDASQLIAPAPVQVNVIP